MSNTTEERLVEIYADIGRQLGVALSKNTFPDDWDAEVAYVVRVALNVANYSIGVPIPDPFPDDLERCEPTTKNWIQ